MLTYNMDTEPNSLWLRTTLGDAALAQPFRCTEAGLFYAKAHFSTARNNKNSYILFFTLKGAGLVEQGDMQVLLQEGQALLLNCRSPQSYCTAPGQSCWHHYWVHIDGSGVQAMEPILNTPHITPITLSGATAHEPFETLLRYIEKESIASILQQSYAIHTLLTNMAKQRLEETAASSNRPMIQEAAEYIRTHYAQPLSLEHLVSLFHVSKSYFLRLFRQYMGTTPYNFLLCCRITNAKEMLIGTDLAIGEIAQRIGFLNEANFSTRFSKMVGQGPLQYRKSARQITHR